MKILVSFLLLLLSVSCRESSDADALSLIDGEWETGCLQREGGSYRTQYTFSEGDQAERTDQFFASEVCTELSAEIEHEGTYVLQVTRDPTEYLIDLRLGAAEVTPESPGQAALWTSGQHCGVALWTSGEGETLGTEPQAACLHFGPDFLYRDLIKLEGDQLSFGGELNAFAARPTMVDPAALSRRFERK